MLPDPIVEEVRAVRRQLEREYGDDLDAIVATLRRHEAAGGHKVVSLAPKPAPRNEGQAS